jgi:hypothetical protein
MSWTWSTCSTAACFPVQRLGLKGTESSPCRRMWQNNCPLESDNHPSAVVVSARPSGSDEPMQPHHRRIRALCTVPDFTCMPIARKTYSICSVLISLFPLTYF